MDAETVHDRRRKRPHWVYRMFDAGGRLLYIGQTSNPTDRLSRWRRKAPSCPWVSEIVRMTWREYPSWWHACTAERQAIEAERPRHNVHHNRAAA